MAKIVKQDPGKRIQEDSERELRSAFQKAREHYIEGLKNSDEFQRFVVEPFELEVDAMADVRTWPTGSVEDLAKLTFHTKLALNTVEKFIKPFRR